MKKTGHKPLRRPKNPKSSFFDLQAFLDVLPEKSDEIYLCQRAKTQEANPQYGIEAEYGFSCRRVFGHVINQPAFKTVGGQMVELGQVPEITLEGGKMKEERLVAWIQSLEFSHDDITSESYLWYDGYAYQMQHLRTIHHRGLDLIFAYELVETEGTSSISRDTVINGNPNIQP